MKLNKYLRIKHAARFDLTGVPAEDSHIYKSIDDLSTRAGVPVTETVRVEYYNDPTDDAIGNSYVHRPLITINTAYPHANDYFTSFHEYGHRLADKYNSSSEDMDRLRRADTMPRTLDYKPLHSENELAADTHAKKLLDQIPNETDRREAKRLYSRATAYNLYGTRLAKPVEVGGAYGATIGSNLGLYGGGALGIYLGYNGADKLYRYFNKDTKNKRYKKTQAHSLANFGGAALGGITLGILGHSIGDKYGGSAGAWIGRQFVPQRKIDQLNRIHDKIENEQYQTALQRDFKDILIRNGIGLQS